MKYSEFIIKNRLLSISKIAEKIKLQRKEDEDDILKAHNDSVFSNQCANVLSDLIDIKLALYEMHFNENATNKSPLIYTIEMMIDKYKPMSEQDLHSTTQLLPALFESFTFNNKCRYTIPYNFNFEIEKIALDPLYNLVKNISRDINILDLACKSGDDLAYFDKPNLKKFGSEVSSSHLSNARKVLDRAIKGELKGSRITNGCFDIALARLPIHNNMEQNTGFFNSFSRTDREYVSDILRYLKVESSILICLPFYRMTKDMCLFLARNLDNVSVYKSSHDKFIAGNLIYIYGVKAFNKEVKENCYEMLRNVHLIDDLKVIDETATLNHTVSNKYVSVDLFKGSQLDMMELHDIVNESNIKADIYEHIKVDKIGEDIVRPLLPFNVGQLGLVLTSGCLDGEVKDIDGSIHLVKGRIIKSSETERSVDDGVVENVTVTSNKVQINIMLADGTIKNLS